MKINEYIAELRMKNNMSQEDLASASKCTCKTITRIESGESQPRKNTFINIMKVFSINEIESKSIWEWYKNNNAESVTRLIAWYIYRKEFDILKKEVDEWDNVSDYKSSQSKQHIMYAKAYILASESDLRGAIDLAREAIKISITDFDIDNVKGIMRASDIELKLINSIAFWYVELTEYQRAINVLLPLTDDKCLDDIDTISKKYYTMIMSNILTYFNHFEQYENIREHYHVFHKYCNDTCETYYIPHMQCNYGSACMRLGFVDEGKRYLALSYHTFLGRGNESYARIVADDAMEDFGLDVKEFALYDAE